MPTSIASPMRWTACVAGLVVALVSANVANCAEKIAISSDGCAAREVLLMALVEAHGTVPNVASEQLAAHGIEIMQARAACDNGDAKDALALFDRLIDELRAALTHPSP